MARIFKLVGIAFGIGIGLALVSVVAHTGGEPSKPLSLPEKPSVPDTPRLKAGVGYDGSNIVVANLMDFDIVDVSLYLDPGIISSGFSYGYRRIKRHSAVLIPSAHFQKYNGVRFNPFKDEPSIMRITARNATGAFFKTTESVKALR